MFSKSALQSDGSIIYRHPNADPSASLNEIALADLPFKDGGPIRNLHDTFERGRESSPHDPCLGARLRIADSGQWESSHSWRSYDQVASERNAIGNYLCATTDGKQWPQVIHGKFTVGIYSSNRPEWTITELACQSYDFVSVALYDTLGAESSRFIMNHSKVPVLVLSTLNIPKILAQKDHMPYLKYLVSMDASSSASGPHLATLRSWCAEKGVQLIFWDEIMARYGGDHSKIATRPSTCLDDVTTICYTSGTTGEPKGALLTQRSLLSTIPCLQNMGVSLSRGDCAISYLPLAHVYERAWQVLILSGGSRIGFFRNDPLLIVEDMAMLQPTVFFSVPRLLNRLHQRLTALTIGAPGIRGFIFRRAFAAKMNAFMSQGGDSSHWFWDASLFARVRAALGGKVRYVTCGSAPIEERILVDLSVMLSATVLVGYGLTESAACGAGYVLRSRAQGTHVGGAEICMELKLCPVDEMKYSPSDKPFPRGEVCIRGPCVFSGYLNDAEKTAEALDNQGWLHTGDIGVIKTPDNRLALIDRKKHIFKLAHGEYVAPEKLEAISACHPLVVNVFVCGDALKSDLVAVVVPDEIELRKLLPPSASQQTLCDLCMDAEAAQKVPQLMQAIGSQNKLCLKI